MNWSGHSKLMRLAAVSKSETWRLIKAIDKRKHLVAGPFVLGNTAFVVVLSLSEIGPDVVQEMYSDLVDFLRQLGLTITMSILFALLAFSIPLAIVVYQCLRRWLLGRQIDHHLFTPACFWCGYVLKGLEQNDCRIRCPECGKQSPVARDYKTEQENS